MTKRSWTFIVFWGAVYGTCSLAAAWLLTTAGGIDLEPMIPDDVVPPMAALYFVAVGHLVHDLVHPEGTH